MKRGWRRRVDCESLPGGAGVPVLTRPTTPSDNNASQGESTGSHSRRHVGDRRRGRWRNRSRIAGRTGRRRAAGVGAVCAARYWLRFPFWGDETDAGGQLRVVRLRPATQGLENCQIAPLLFLWGERRRTVGSAREVSHAWCRCWPVASAGWRGPAPDWPVAVPRARLFAVGFLAVRQHLPISMSTLVKPYSFDLMMALALLVLAVHWLCAEQRRWRRG